MSLRHCPPLRRTSSEPLEPDPDYTGVGKEVCVTFWRRYQPTRRLNNRKVNKTTAILISLSTLIGTASATQLTAQEADIFELEPIRVRGDLLGGSINELPSSVSIFNSEEATTSGKAHLENILGQMPNLNWAGGTSRPRYFQIRGIGENSQFGNELPASSVGFIVDGIDLTGVGGVAGLFDVGHVEVLRGPQAAAYGANALAGMILVETVAPSSQTDGRIELTAGDNYLFSFGVAAGGAIGKESESKLSYRVSYNMYQDNGYRDNSFLKRDNTNERNEETARIKLNWTPSANFEVDLTVLYFDFENGYDAWSLTNDSFNTTTDEPGEDNQETAAVGLRATWHLSDSIDLSYQGSFADSDTLYSYDWDWSNPQELMDLYGPEVYWGTDVTDRQREVISHDVRLASPVSGPNSGQAFSWATGVYYRDFDEEQLYFGLNSSYTTETIALYGQGRFQFNDRWSMTLAGRVEDVSIDYSDTADKQLGSDDQPWGGKAALEYRMTTKSLIYASVDRGFKAGGVNLDNDIPEESRVYGTETLWNYEMGWRGFLLEDRMRVQVTAFYMDREDIQVDSSIQVGDGNTFALFKDNAASGQNYGAEIEVNFQATEQIRFIATLGLLETKFNDYSYIDPNDGVTEIVLDGMDQAYAPGYTFSLAAEYAADNGFFAGAQLEGKDSYLFDVANDKSLSSFMLLHLNVGYTTGKWRFTLWGNNILDETYDTRGFYFANEPPLYDNPRKWVSQGAPRQLGVSASRSF